VFHGLKILDSGCEFTDIIFSCTHIYGLNQINFPDTLCILLSSYSVGLLDMEPVESAQVQLPEPVEVDVDVEVPESIQPQEEPQKLKGKAIGLRRAQIAKEAKMAKEEEGAEAEAAEQEPPKKLKGKAVGLRRAQIAREAAEAKQGENNTLSVNTEQREQGDQDMKEAEEAEEEAEEAEPYEPMNTLKAAIGDPMLPHLLRIGQDGTSELVTLSKMSIQPKGDFNTLYIGNGIKELPLLYNVRTPEQYTAMQRAFGVNKISQQPPIHALLEKGCKFEGFDLVKRALENRLQTLNESIALKGNTMQGRVDKQRVHYINSLLEKMSGIQEECPPESVAVEKPQRNNIPSLDHLSLLRDLIYLVVLLHGNADPFVKEQLDRIPLEKLLNSARRNNLPTSKLLVKEAIDILSKTLGSRSGAGAEEEEQVFKTIYKSLRPGETIPEQVTLEVILKIIEENYNAIDQMLAVIQNCESIEQAMKEVEKELAYYKSLNAEKLARVLELEEAEKKYEEANAKLMEAEKQLASLQEETASSMAESATLESTKEMELAAANALLKASQEAVEASKKELESLRAELEDTTKALEDESAAKKLIEEKTKELEKMIAAGSDSGDEVELLRAQIGSLTHRLQKESEKFVKMQTEFADYRFAHELSPTKDQYYKMAEELEKVYEEKHDIEDKLNAELNALKEEYAKAQIEAAEARTKLQEQIGSISLEKAGMKAVMDSLEKEKVSAAALQGQLEAEQAKLRGCEESAKRQKADSEAQIRKLTEELAAARAAAEQFKNQADAEADFESKLLIANSKIKSLEEQVEAATSTGSTQEAAYKESISELKKSIELLETQLAESKAAEANTASKATEERRRCEESIAQKEAEIARLVKELGDVKIDSEGNEEILEKQLEAAKAAKAAAEAKLVEAQTQIGETLKAKDNQIYVLGKQAMAEKERANALSKELGQRPTDQSLQDLQATLKAKEVTIQTLRGELAGEQKGREQNAEDALSRIGELEAELEEERQGREKNAEDSLSKIGELEAELEEVRQGRETNIEEAMGEAIEEIGAKQEEIDALQSKIQELELQALQKATPTTSKDDTKKRLENLLGMVLINPELADVAKQYMAGQISQEDAEKVLKKDVCNFFRYFADLINLQEVKLFSTGLPPEAKVDIFSIYKNIPKSREVDSEKLLIDITNLFQELFVNIGKTNSVPKEVELKKEYPELSKVLGQGAFSIENGSPLKDIDGPKITKLLTELGSFGYLTKVGIEPFGEGRFKIRKEDASVPLEFASTNKKYYTPLVVLGIKMIQLLSDLFETKYKSVLERCAIFKKKAVIAVESPKAAAPLRGPKRKSVDEIKDEASKYTKAYLENSIITHYELLQKAPRDSEDFVYYLTYLSVLLQTLSNRFPRIAFIPKVQAAKNYIDELIKDPKIKGVLDPTRELISKAPSK
jgi:hypothetical protein